jgi:hypothetical protein
MKSSLVRPAVMVLLFLGGCGNPLTERSPSTEGGSGPNSESNVSVPAMDPVFLVDPLGENGRSVSGAADADLPFVAEVPNGLEEAQQVEATAKDVSPLEAQIAWVFDTKDLGHFVIFERVTVPAEQEMLEEMARAEPGCTTEKATEEQQAAFGEGAEVTHCSSGNGSVKTIRQETDAVLVDGPHETSVIWQQPLKVAEEGAYDDVKYPLMLEIRVVGPMAEFSTEQALDVANRI